MSILRDCVIPVFQIELCCFDPLKSFNVVQALLIVVFGSHVYVPPSEASKQYRRVPNVLHGHPDTRTTIRSCNKYTP